MGLSLLNESLLHKSQTVVSLFDPLVLRRRQRRSLIL